MQDYFFNESAKRMFGGVMSAIAIGMGAFIVYNSALKGYEQECRTLSDENNLPDPNKFCSSDCRASNLVLLVNGGMSFDEAYFTVKEECKGKK